MKDDREIERIPFKKAKPMGEGEIVKNRNKMLDETEKCCHSDEEAPPTHSVHARNTCEERSKKKE